MDPKTAQIAEPVQSDMEIERLTLKNLAFSQRTAIQLNNPQTLPGYVGARSFDGVINWGVSRICDLGFSALMKYVFKRPATTDVSSAQPEKLRAVGGK